MLQNAYFLAKIGADTAENKQHFAEILPIGRRVGVSARRDLLLMLRLLRLLATWRADRSGGLAKVG